jgi:protein-glutamine gamma-glutamyltransferase
MRAHPLPPRHLQWLAMAALAAGSVGLDPTWLLGLLTLALLVLAALKLVEAGDRGGRRLVALLQLLVCGLQAAQRPDLLPSLVQLLAAVLSLAGLLQLESGQATPWRRLLRQSLQVLAAALPMALVLFLLVPRLEPLIALPEGPSGRAVTGLSADLDPGSIATLADDDSPAARVAFADDRPPPPEQRYWRVLVHERFDGRRWQRDDEDGQLLRPEPAGSEAARGLEKDLEEDLEEAADRDQVWLAEPGRFTAVPWDGRSGSPDPRLRLEPQGELRLLRPPIERRSYRLRPAAAPRPWQQRPPTPEALALPAAPNPRLQALGRRWGQLPDPAARLAAAQTWFEAGGFRYDRRPGALPERDGLDVFLFESRVGFCGHYASAFSALMRAAGVPSRTVSGYLGGTWVVPVGGASYLELRQSDAHAWSEVWLADRGWQRVDPSAWAGAAAGQGPAAMAARADATPAAGGWRWLQRQWWGLDMAWSRWWLGFDRSRQEALLAWLLGRQRWALGLVILAGVALGLVAALVAWQLHRSRPRRDTTARELAPLLTLLRSLRIEPRPGETLEELCRRTGKAYPNLAAPLEELASCHARRHYGEPAGRHPSARLEATRWRRSLRQLKRARGSAIRQTGGSGP